MSRRAETILIFALAVLPALAALHSRSFFSPDETSYAQVAREMLETRNFVVPTIDGKPWLEKPPLVYWLLAGAFALLGWGFPAAVLLNALLTAGTALVIAAHVRRTGTPRAAMLAAVGYLTMFLPLATARSALTDPSLTLCTTGAVAMFLVDGWPAGIGAGALLGLGVLAKGPVAPLVVLPALAAVAVGGRHGRASARALISVVVAAAVALPWHLALASRGLWHEFAAVFLGRQVLSRAVDTWGIGSPWWFYLPALWLAAFPWGTHLALGVRGLWRRLSDSVRYRPDFLAEAAAVVVPLVTFSISINKLPHYVLPLMPWLAIWLGRSGDAALDRAEDDRLSRSVRLAVPLVGTVALAALAVIAARSAIGRVLPPQTPWVLAAAAAAFAALGLAEVRGARLWAWGGLVALALGLRLGLDVSLLPTVDRQTIERPLAAAVRDNLPLNGVPIAHRWWRASFVAYGVRGWSQTQTRAELAVALASAASEGKLPLVLVRSDSEGEVRAAVWSTGGVAREVARVSGLGELNGQELQGIIFSGDRARDGTRWFYDADGTLAGERGFDALEGNQWTPSFRWSLTHEAHVPVTVAAGRDYRLRLRSWGPSRQQPQLVRVKLNGATAADLALGAFPEVHEAPIPSAWLRDGVQDLSFEVGHLVVPAESDPTSRDTRPLAFALDWVALDPTPGGGQAAQLTLRR